MFEEASRTKLRFTPTNGGIITTEDLWDLPLLSSTGVCLDDLAKKLNQKLKDESEESFVVKKSKTKSRTELQFNIVKHIIQHKLDVIEKTENVLRIRLNVKRS